MTEIPCVVCGTPIHGTNGALQPATKLTCSPVCHEEFVKLMIFKYGEFKKISRLRTGESFKVPLRDIIEHGIKEQDLDKYPKWEEK
jgi:hypothetical protein